MHPNEVTEIPLNLTTQAILTFGSWGLTAVVLIVAIRMGIRERTPFYPLMVLAALVGAFAEPLYDVAMNLYFFSTDGMWTHFTALNTPQPIWTHSGYAILYGSAALLIAREIGRGTLTARRLFALAGLEVLMSVAFETFAINGNAYAYWGPHTFRFFDYPLVCAVLEAAQVICFATAAALLRSRATNPWQLTGLLVIFPCTFFGANFGAGWPTVISINAEHTSTALVAVATLASMALAATLVRLAAALLPVAGLPATNTEDCPSGLDQQFSQPVLDQAGVVKQR